MHISVSSDPEWTDLAKEDLDDFDLCATILGASKRFSYRLYIECTYPLKGRFLNIIKNSGEPSSFSLNEIIPHLYGEMKYLYRNLIWQPEIYVQRCSKG